MQKNNLEPQDSRPQTPSIGVDETSSDWEFDGMTIFRAMGYIVGLLAFMVGTAIFMLGLSLAVGSLTQAGSILYGLAVAALSGRILIDRSNPPMKCKPCWWALHLCVRAGLSIQACELFCGRLACPDRPSGQYLLVHFHRYDGKFNEKSCARLFPAVILRSENETRRKWQISRF
jgi:hypothetical protein